jgi:hypothetical protein
VKRRTLIAALLLPSLFGGSAVAAHREEAASPGKLTICHRTGSDTNPFLRITVSKRAVDNPKSKSGKLLWGHIRHAGDAILVGTAACPSPSQTAEVSNKRPSKVAICHKTHSKKNPYRRIMVSSRAVTNPNSQAGKTLRGHMRHAGDIVMPGATACPSGGTTQQRVQLTASLQPLPGALGSGTATVTIRVAKSELCYTLSVSGLGSSVTAAHIHRGTTTGIVIPLAAPTNGSSSGCVTVEKSLLREIVANPSEFYINVHTQDWLDGQVRGDLTK